MNYFCNFVWWLVNSWVASSVYVLAKLRDIVLLTFKGLKDWSGLAWKGAAFLYASLFCAVLFLREASYAWEVISLLSVWYVVWCLLFLRASVERKDFAYVKEYGRYIFILSCAALMVAFVLPFFLCWYTAPLVSGVALGLFGGSVLDYGYALIPTAFAATPAAVFCILFYLETEGSVRDFCTALSRGLLMVLINYPVCWIIAFSQLACFKIFDAVGHYLGVPGLGVVIFLLTVPIWLSVLNVLYLLFLSKDSKALG